MFLYDLSLLLSANINGIIPKMVGMINRYVKEAKVAFCPNTNLVTRPYAIPSTIPIAKSAYFCFSFVIFLIGSKILF